MLAVATMGRDPAAVTAMEALRLGVMPSAADLKSGKANMDTIQARLLEVKPRGCCGGGSGAAQKSGCGCGASAAAKAGCGCGKPAAIAAAPATTA